jgi:predicted metal-dependent hydrolase
LGIFSNERIQQSRDFGEIIYTKSRHAKKVSIALKPFEGVRVTVPVRVSFADAERIVQEKHQWISEHIGRIREIENRYTLFTEDTIFNTYAHQLKLIRGEKGHSNISIRISGRELVIVYPADFDVEDDRIQEAVRYGITNVLRMEAEKILPKKTEELAQIHGFRYSKLTFRDTKTRWGSCSHDNKISLNIQLMRLPERLIDYVILHELCHTVEKNHGPQFWELLQQVSGNARAKARELQKFSTKIW